MAFTAADVKTLREMTGVGMLDCKKALAETDGDMDKAVELLREKGLAAAQKKAGRIAAEGMAYAEVFSDGAALVEVNAETDFVAKNDQFIEFVKDVCYVVGKWGPVDMDTLMTLPYRKTGLTVQQMLQEKVLVIGENIKIRRFARYEGAVTSYVHAGGRIGVIVKFDTTDDIAAVRDAMADTSVVYDGVTGTFSLDATGTPTKGGAIIEYYVDDATGTVSQRLETTISADELT